ncbi:hypothetical protein O0L34_g9043 [Tuta absoluta]|nr:hypothetical protein O0L34_g9043 [Tuta absoluta]
MVSRPSLDRAMTKDESYVQRRQLFKGIWDTALSCEKGKEDILKKPKVIKTLRMDEIDRCPIGKTKKERIRNLRHVCNRILEFCNREEAHDVFYEKLQTAATAEANLTKTSEPPTKKKRAKLRVKRKLKKAKSMDNFKQEPTVVTLANMRAKMKEIPEEDLIRSDSDLSSNYSTDSSKPKKRKTVRRKSRKVKPRIAGNSVRYKSMLSGRSGSAGNDYPKEGTASKRKSLRRRTHIKKLKAVTPKVTVSPQIISV